ncbi:transcription termination/antitermination factor NusG, partial [Bacteroides fluxus YIT 12057]
MENETEIWYAMRATYRREPDAMRLLEKEKLGCFVPMQYKMCIRKGKKIRALVPVVHNLIFVHARPSEVQRVKSQVTYLQYITDTRSGKKIIIPDVEMQRFIAVAGSYNDHLLYFQPEELNLSKGTKVR